MNKKLKGKPTKPGWYWYEDENFGLVPVEVNWTGFVEHENARQLDITWPEDNDELPLFEDAKGNWRGPIIPPKEGEAREK